MTEDTLKPVAWMDDGTTRAGSTATSFRVVTDETRESMPSASSVSFTTPLVRLSDAQAALAAAEERGRSEERERWMPDVEFLLDRLYDINLDDDTDDLIRDWNGHVEPAIARLRDVTKEPTP